MLGLEIRRFMSLQDLQQISVTPLMRRGETGYLAIEIATEPPGTGVTAMPLLVKATVHYPSGSTLGLPLKLTDSNGRAEWRWLVSTDAGAGRGYVEISDNTFQTKVWFKVE